MTDKKKDDGYLDFTGNLIAGGAGLAIGAGMIETLPASGAKAGVQAGLSTAGSFFPTMATIHAAGIVTKQMKDLRGIRNTGQKEKQQERGFRL